MSAVLTMKHNRTARIVVLATVIAITTVILLIAWRWPFSQPRITRSLQETFPATVTFQKFRPTYFPHPGCVAEGLAFKRLGSSLETPPIVTIQQFKIEAHYLDLLLRPGYLARIVAVGFQVHVPPLGTKVEETGWKETHTRTRLGKIVLDGSSVEIARKDSAVPLRFDVHRLRLTSVADDQPLSYDLVFHNPLPPGEIRAHGTFGPWNYRDAGETPVAGQYHLQAADLGVFAGIAGTLSSDDKFQGKLSHIEARGSVDVPDFEVTRSRHSVHLSSEFHAFVNGTNGDIQLERVSATLRKTLISAKGEIARLAGQHGKTASLDLTVADGRIQDVFRLFVRETTPPLNGVTSFRAHAILPPGETPFLEKVRLSGDFGIAGGQFTNPATQGTVSDFSQRASGEKPDDDEEDKDRIISKLSGHVDLRNAVATFSNFAFVVPGASAQMHGTYHLEKRTVDLHGTLRSEAELSEMSSGFKSVLLKPFDALFKKKHAGAVVPVHLIGTYDDPQPGVDIVSKKSAPENTSPAN
jgi:hypothetical protein